MKVAFFKGIHPGVNGIYSRGVRLLTKSIYSHCEIIFSNGISASSSFIDGGVRFTSMVEYNDKDWDYIELPDSFEANAWQWFVEHDDEGYDLLGNLHFIFTVVGDDKYKWFCSEAIGAALGLENPWRFDPGSLYQVLSMLSKVLKEVTVDKPLTAIA
jgi:hypothetical protein